MFHFSTDVSQCWLLLFPSCSQVQTLEGSVKVLATLGFGVKYCEEEVLQILGKIGSVLIGVLQVFAFGALVIQLLREPFPCGAR